MIRSLTVLILLSIPALELVMPGMCPEDLQGFSLSLALAHQTDASPEPAVTAQTPAPDHPDEPGYPVDDECFCCCHHITPQMVFVLPEGETCAEPDAEKPALYISPPGDPLDHPPQLS